MIQLFLNFIIDVLSFFLNLIIIPISSLFDLFFPFLDTLLDKFYSFLSSVSVYFSYCLDAMFLDRNMLIIISSFMIFNISIYLVRFFIITIIQWYNNING